tara:strand:- start:1085 stop:1660 length:576 start_codon:yes stop_codon:yes gene_type:complete
MDYKQALQTHVYYQKTLKPQIKNLHEGEMRLHAEKKEFIRMGVEHLNYVILKSDDGEEKDWNIKRFTQVIKNQTDRLAFTRNTIDCLSYLYKEDYENSVISLHKFKESAHIMIEDPENCRGVNSVTKEGERVKTMSGEAAYLFICNDVKHKMEIFEEWITILGVVDGEVKEILKAGRKMNKRNGKKNRGKK